MTYASTSLLLYLTCTCNFFLFNFFILFRLLTSALFHFFTHTLFTFHLPLFLLSALSSKTKRAARGGGGASSWRRRWATFGLHAPRVRILLTWRRRRRAARAARAGRRAQQRRGARINKRAYRALFCTPPPPFMLFLPRACISSRNAARAYNAARMAASLIIDITP